MNQTEGVSQVPQNHSDDNQTHQSNQKLSFDIKDFDLNEEAIENTDIQRIKADIDDIEKIQVGEFNTVVIWNDEDYNTTKQRSDWNNWIDEKPVPVPVKHIYGADFVDGGGNETNLPSYLQAGDYSVKNQHYAFSDEGERRLLESQKRSEIWDLECSKMEVGINTFREYKKCWSKLLDAFLFRSTQIEKAGKKNVKFVSAKIKESIDAINMFELNSSGIEYFKGFENERTKTLEFIGTLKLYDQSLKKPLKEELSRMVKHVLTLQNNLFTSLKERKDVLYTEIIHNQPANDKKEEMMMED